MQQSIRNLFIQYERLANIALSGKPETDTLGALYDEAFISSSPAGIVAVQNDGNFGRALESAIAHYREIGVDTVAVASLRLTPLDAMHALVHIDWRASVRGDEVAKSTKFTNAYLVRFVEGQARIFGWITGEDNVDLISREGENGLEGVCKPVA